MGRACRHVLFIPIHRINRIGAPAGAPLLDTANFLGVPRDQANRKWRKRSAQGSVARPCPATLRIAPDGFWSCKRLCITAADLLGRSAEAISVSERARTLHTACLFGAEFLCGLRHSRYGFLLILRLHVLQSDNCQANFSYDLVGAQTRLSHHVGAAAEKERTCARHADGRSEEE